VRAFERARATARPRPACFGIGRPTTLRQARVEHRPRRAPIAAVGSDGRRRRLPDTRHVDVRQPCRRPYTVAACASPFILGTGSLFDHTAWSSTSFRPSTSPSSPSLDLPACRAGHGAARGAHQRGAPYSTDGQRHRAKSLAVDPRLGMAQIYFQPGATAGPAIAQNNSVSLRRLLRIPAARNRSRRTSSQLTLSNVPGGAAHGQQRDLPRRKIFDSG